MSRHRHLRHMDYDDYYDHEDDEDDDEASFDEDEDDEAHVPYDPAEHKGTLQDDVRKELAQVRDVLGDGTDGISDDVIRKALVSHGKNVERTIEYLLSREQGSGNGTATRPFGFDNLSPDDIVKQARGGKALPGGQSVAAKAQLQKTAKNAPTAGAAGPTRVVDNITSDMEGLGLTGSRFDAKPSNGSRNSLNLPSPAMSMRNSPKMSRSGSTEGSAANLASGSHGPSALRNSSAAASVTSVKSSPKWKRVNVPEEFAKRSSSGKERLNLVVVGHVDAGKSTMMGHMLVLLGEVSERTIKKYERDAEKMKKGSFAFAWVLDETEDERTRGVTIDVAVSKFETPKHSYTLLDAPGHKDFIPNMISGASQADAAILVVDSNTGEFEAGFDHGGQTREHAILVRSLGVAQLIVAVNKLDAVDWSQERFSEIREKILPFLTQVGFKKQRVTFVPCSGFMGENLKTSSVAALKAWYSGPTLVEALDAFEAPARPIDKPLRMSIQDIFKGGIGAGGGDVTVSGRLEAGCLQLGDPILAMPVHETGQVRAIEIGEESVTWAAAGDRVTISIAGLDVQQLGTGDVLCDPMRAVPVTTHFKAQIVTFDIAIPLTIGVPVVVHHLGRSEAGHISRLEAVLNKATGEVTKRNPRALTKSMTAIVEIRTSRALCIELFKDSKELGRFMLRSGSTTVAAGIVVDVLSYERGGVSAAASTTLSTTAASS